MFINKKCIFALILACFLIFTGQNAIAQDVGVDIYIDDPGRGYDYKLWQRKAKEEQKIYETGFKLLNANKFPRRVHFVLNQGWRSKQKINASARYSLGTVTIYKGLLRYIDNDDELAAVLAHEIAHIHQLSTGFWPWKRLKMHFASKYYEYDADLKGIDYMVKAGYNPLAMISLSNKIYPEKSAFVQALLYLLELRYLFIPSIDTHPNGSDRLFNMYEHIRTNYPRFLTEENKNRYYINFLINSEKNEDVKNIKDRYDLTVPEGYEDL